MNQLNLVLRFILEMAVIVIAAIWGWNAGDGILRFILAISIPVILSVIWGVFAVKDDPFRSGKTVVQTPGIVRLLIEILFFGFAAWAINDLGHQIVSSVIVFLAVIHYAFSIKRIKWLMKQR